MLRKSLVAGSLRVRLSRCTSPSTKKLATLPPETQVPAQCSDLGMMKMWSRNI